MSSIAYGARARAVRLAACTVAFVVLLLALPQPLQAACNPHPKKALASVYHEIANPQSNPLCLPSHTLYHNWMPGHAVHRAGGVTYQQVPMVWSDVHLDWWCEDYYYYQGVVLVANEPTNPPEHGGAWLTAEQTGKLMADVASCAPSALLVGPNHHPTIAVAPSDWMARFLATYQAHGGSVSRIVANGFHVYPNQAMPGLWAGEQIDYYYDEILPPALRGKPVFITEMGHKNSWGDAYAGSRELFSSVLNHPKVVWAFGFSAVDYGQNMGFQTGGVMTDAGRGFRDAR